MRFEFGSFPETYTDLDSLYKKVIYKLTGAVSVGLIVTGCYSFRFEDLDNPNNPYMNSIVGVVDPESDIDIYSDYDKEIIYIVDEDYTNDKTVCLATDSLEGGALAVLNRCYRLKIGT